MKTIQEIIDYMESTDAESWGINVVRTSSGQNCFFGHLFNMGVDQSDSNNLWSHFEARWATTYMLYPVNDGTHPNYKQATAKERVIAYLKNLRDGKEKNTTQLMDEYDNMSDHELQSRHIKTLK